jgi:hypothetical protein
MRFKALSIVYPGGQKIASGEKSIEVRSWEPPTDLTGELLIVENHKFLRADGEMDPDGRPVAIVRIKCVREFHASDVPAACASRWDPECFSWELTDVQPIQSDKKVLAARGIYELDIEGLY